MKNFGEFFKFLCNVFFINFYKFYKVFINFTSTFVLNVPLEQKYWSRHCSTGFERNSSMKFFFMFPFQSKILEPPLHTVYTVYLSVVTCAPFPQIFIRGGPHAKPHQLYHIEHTKDIVWHKEINLCTQLLLI